MASLPPGPCHDQHAAVGDVCLQDAPWEAASHPIREPSISTMKKNLAPVRVVEAPLPLSAGSFGRRVGVVEGPDAIVDDKVGEVVLVVV